MDDELALKYKLPEGYDPNNSNKKRKGGSVDLEGTNKSHPKGTAQPPASSSRGGEAKEEGGKGKKGGQGKGREWSWGKGGKGSEAPATVPQILTTHAKALLRLEQDRRDRDRSLQWAIDFKLPYTLPVMLQHAVDVHRANRPEKGPHPDGNLNDVQWRLLASTMLEDFGKLEPNRENYDKDQKVVQFLGRSLYRNEERGPDGARTSCNLLKPVHRINADSKAWTWVFRLRQDTSRGREAHEILLTCSEHFEELHTNVSVRKDRAPKDGLYRQLERQLEDLRL